MKHALINERCPLDANLETVLPGVHQWHRANDSAMSQLKTGLEGLGRELAGRLDTLQGTIQTGQEESEDRLAETFMDIARGIMAKRGLKRSPESSFDEEDEQVPSPSCPRMSTENEDYPVTVLQNVRMRTNASKYSTGFYAAHWVCILIARST
jgi:hypothetical protein